MKDEKKCDKSDAERYQKSFQNNEIYLRRPENDVQRAVADFNGIFDNWTD